QLANAPNTGEPPNLRLQDDDLGHARPKQWSKNKRGAEKNGTTRANRQVARQSGQKSANWRALSRTLCARRTSGMLCPVNGKINKQKDKLWHTSYHHFRIQKTHWNRTSTR